MIGKKKIRGLEVGLLIRLCMSLKKVSLTNLDENIALNWNMSGIRAYMLTSKMICSCVVSYADPNKRDGGGGC